MKNTYYISTKKFTCSVDIKDGIIIETAPILKQFKNQHFNKLRNWLYSKFPEVSIILIKHEE